MNQYLYQQQGIDCIFRANWFKTWEATVWSRSEKRWAQVEQSFGKDGNTSNIGGFACFNSDNLRIFSFHRRVNSYLRFYAPYQITQISVPKYLIILQERSNLCEFIENSIFLPQTVSQ